MRRKLLIAGLIVILVIAAISIVWCIYDLSSDYNYATAKIDIKNGEAKIINVGIPEISSKNKEIKMIADRYGFKNIYIEKYTPQQTEKGVKNYNELTEAYLTWRNGSNWKANYKRKVDSLYKIAGD